MSTNALSLTMSAGAIKVGDKIPSVELDYGFPPEKVNIAARAAGKKMIVVGLPGAFTPTWSNVQVPGYLEKQDALKAQGISEVLVFCVNDAAVMGAWAADQGVEGSMITFMGDPASKLTKELGIVLDHPGVLEALGTPRCKRSALYLDDGVIKAFEISEGPDDPAGDAHPEATCVDNMLKHVAGSDEL